MFRTGLLQAWYGMDDSLIISHVENECAPVIKFNRCNLLSYEYVFNSGERLVYRRWTRSMHSCLPWGDHSIELYSSKCIRHTQ